VNCLSAARHPTGIRMIASTLRGCDHSQYVDTLTLIQRNGWVKCYVGQPTLVKGKSA
jgi:hypothetical protein